MTYIAPTCFATSFSCPSCGAISHQTWSAFDWDLKSYSIPNQNPLRISTCAHCNSNTLWFQNDILLPDVGLAPLPNPEMPKDVQSLYLEAASISAKSPRGAAALLRLAVQVLCKSLGEKGENISDDISKLVKKGLPELVQQSLDVVRVTGNNAVHPGVINTDDPDTVANLFALLNVIVEYMVALPNRVSGLYTALPQPALDSIKRRDAL